MGMIRNCGSLILVLSGLAVPIQSDAGSIFRNLPEMLDHEWNSHRVLNASRLTRGQRSSSFNLGERDRYDDVQAFLRQNGVHPLLNLKTSPSELRHDFKSLGLTTSNILTTREYKFHVGPYEVCKASVKTVETPDGRAQILGDLPNVDAVYPTMADAWISKTDAVAVAQSQARENGHDPDSVRVASMSRCLYPVHGELQPVWRMIARFNEVPYQLYIGRTGIVDGELFSFDVSATVKAYDTNPTTGTLKDFTIDVTGDGTMTNNYFTTADGGSSGAGREKSSSNSFSQSAGGANFAEQSSFAHVNQQYDFVTGLGYVWKGVKPLTVKTHVTFSGGNVNNAQYTPYDGTSGPTIQIADGDGSILQNLPFDSDVVSHEFGHHVVFSNVTSTSGESLVLHEGLADTITFMRTGDACLGESICPASSSLCQVKGQCLRSGASTLIYGSDTYTKLSAHLKGQVVSSFFWDLRKGGSIPAADLNKILMGTISFLPSSADIKSLITAVLNADFSLFNKQYQSIILAAAEARGMGVSELGISVSSIDGKLDSSSDPTATTTETKESKKGFLGLCSIGTNSENLSSQIVLILGLLLPILTQLLRKPKVVPVKITRK